MARSPYFIRQLRLNPADDNSVENLYSLKKGNSINFINPEVFKQSGNSSLTDFDASLFRNKARNEFRILNISDSLDSVRTYSWQAEFYFQVKPQFSENPDISDINAITNNDPIIGTRIPRLTVAIKSFDFPNNSAAPQEFSIGGVRFTTFQQRTDPIFKIEIADLLEGGDILHWLQSNNLLAVTDFTTGIPFNLKLTKYNTFGDPTGGVVFKICNIYGYKLGSFDYQKAGEMLHHQFDIRYNQIKFCDSIEIEKSITEIETISATQKGQATI
jgi:hypothetical protein